MSWAAVLRLTMACCGDSLASVAHVGLNEALILRKFGSDVSTSETPRIQYCMRLGHPAVSVTLSARKWRQADLHRGGKRTRTGCPQPVLDAPSLSPKLQMQSNAQLLATLR